ncbi:flagellar basal-body rod protein FlgF [Pararhizobium mangrovi]|uniref:Flagellar basal-body rod protein FlgF n=1 Tax=Pararhizobium mangrovi TaxID=2590452 RepID=A0A506U1N4_9HYPH|nr:flagellar basal-body rod protein FlgF [Pararhizobium mangrovi]TPW25757.1 flagellar basal-body rod protein FlgF [Pararhizobium mangrovi]
MQSALYVSLSSQLALEKRLTTIADNVANSGTAGFRATQVKFDQLVSRSRTADVSYVSSGKDFLSTQSGSLEQTGNDLDFAVKGDGWFALDTPAGQVLTRDGRFSMTPAGDLVSTRGYPVLDAGGAPIQLDPNGGTPSVGTDGSIHQDGQLRGAIGLYSADLSGGYSRFENSGVLAKGAVEPIVDRSGDAVMQGYVEGSNVNPVAEMTKLIQVQRAFDNAAGADKLTDRSLAQAVRMIGGSS